MRPPTTTTSGRFSQRRNGASVRSRSPTSRCRMMREPPGDRLGQREVQLAEAKGEHRPPQRIPEGDPAAAVVVVVRLGSVARKRLLDLGALRPDDHPRLRPGRLDAVVDAWLADLGRRPPGAELRGDELRLARRARLRRRAPPRARNRGCTRGGRSPRFVPTAPAGVRSSSRWATIIARAPPSWR